MGLSWSFSAKTNNLALVYSMGIVCWKGDAAAPLQAVTWVHGGFMLKPCMDHL